MFRGSVIAVFLPHTIRQHGTHRYNYYQFRGLPEHRYQPRQFRAQTIPPWPWTELCFQCVTISGRQPIISRSVYTLYNLLDDCIPPPLYRLLGCLSSRCVESEARENLHASLGEGGERFQKRVPPAGHARRAVAVFQRLRGRPVR